MFRQEEMGLHKAVVQNGKVINTCLADDYFRYEDESLLLVKLPDSSSVSIGWSYNQETGEFTPPEPAAPPEPEPDLNAFNLAIMLDLGIRIANDIAARYPIFNLASVAKNWNAASQVLKLALDDGALTQAQYDAIIQRGIQYHVPITTL